MRIRFFAPDDEDETAGHAKLLRGMDDFWRHFAQVAGEPPQAWISELRATLSRVHQDLGLEARTEADGTMTLVVVPLAGPASWPLSQLCVGRAPRRFPWTYESRRPPLPLSQALRLSRETTGLDLGAARARVGVTRGHLLEVVLSTPEVDPLDELTRQAASDFVAMLMGDRLFDSWVAAVSLQRAARNPSLRVVGNGEIPELPLSVHELGQALDAALEGIALGLPEIPLHSFCERAEWTLFELDDVLEVKDGRTPAGGGATELCETPAQSDLLMAATSCPEALKCLLSGQPFSSERFSRHGERFCYLKIRSSGDDEARVQRRSEIEDALDRALVPGRIGCVVGSGLGHDHVYVDLALGNVDAAISVIKSRLLRLGVSEPGWLFFFDDEWSNEWVAMSAVGSAPAAR